MMRLFRTALLALVCLFSLVFSLAAGTAPSFAADYPNRPVKWLIGFAAGGPVDTVARIMSQWLSDRLGQQFVVENRTGSGGNIAAAAAISSPPDGYTLLFVAPNNAISTSLYKKLPYDFIRDTTPVANIMQLTNMLVVSNAMPVKTVQEFIDYCKANPEQGVLCVIGQRHLGAHVGGIVQGDDQVRHGSRALSGIGDRLPRHHFQQGAADLRQSAVGARTGARRHRARARRHLAAALAHRARRPGDRRNRAGIRVRRLLWHLRAKGHAAGDRRHSSTRPSAKR